MTTAAEHDDTRPTDATGAILAMCLAMAFFIISDIFSKLASEQIPVSQLLTLRGAYSALLFAIPVVVAGSMAHLPGTFTRLWGLRIVGEVGAAMTFLAALAHMPIANVTTIVQISPLATTAAAALFLSERVTGGQWVATLVGFMGVLAIVQPGTAAFTWWAVIALASVICVVVRDLATRRMNHSIPGSLINLTTSLGVVAAGLILGLGEGKWVWPDAITHLYLFGSGAGIAIAYHFLIVAIRKASISTIAPFRYTIVPMSLVAGWMIWQEVPNTLALVGIVIIAGSGLYTFLSQSKRPT